MSSEKITNGIRRIRWIRLLVLFYNAIEIVSLRWLGLTVVS